MQIFFGIILIKRLGIGTTTPSYNLDLIGTFRASATSTFSGNVGIGTTAPSEKLEVAGNIKLSGATPTYKITNVAAPIADADVATKGYVDALGGSDSFLYYVSRYNNTTCLSCPNGYTAALVQKRENADCGGWENGLCRFTGNNWPAPFGGYVPCIIGQSSYLYSCLLCACYK